VPWCDTCDRFYNPNTLQADGTCPGCGRQVGEPVVAAADENRAPGAPWHFKLLVLATVVYLGWRLLEGVLWVGHHL
jgi:hypothetical protein